MVKSVFKVFSTARIIPPVTMINSLSAYLLFIIKLITWRKGNDYKAESANNKMYWFVWNWKHF